MRIEITPSLTNNLPFFYPFLSEIKSPFKLARSEYERGKPMEMDVLEQLDLPLKDRRLLASPAGFDSEITDWDRHTYERITSTELTPAQVEWLLKPAEIHLRQEEVLAIHWHPEFLPLDLIARRIEAVYPNARETLIIPTQHNALMSIGDHAGVEVDCFSRSFNRKVQLLLHIKKERADKAQRLRSMIDQTFRYRSSQLIQLLGALSQRSPGETLSSAAHQTGADRQLVDFVRAHSRKLLRLIEERWKTTPPFMLRNKLVVSYFNELRRLYEDRLIDRAVILLAEVKKGVKEKFPPSHFFETREMIEEARSCGAGIVIPHPEQFWPILLADYDVDGYEVWNPQSRQYTEFLVDFVNRQNGQRRGRERLLVFMGDDTHMSEKVIEPKLRDPAKASREIGRQAGWEDESVMEALRAGGFNRAAIIREYRDRLDG